MANHEVKVHEIQYLACGAGKTGGPPNERRIIVITVRPDEGSFRPHNLGIPRHQGERLLEDLKVIFSRSTVCLLLMALAGLTGCSTSVEVEQEKTSSRPEAAAEVLTTERSRTAVAVEMFTDEDGKRVEMPSDGVLVVEGCGHFHEHLHVYLNEGDRNAERTAIEIIREWKDGGCRRD
jgi:uncharacterized protein YceK